MPYPKASRAGRVMARCTVCGAQAVADGSGDPVTLEHARGCTGGQFAMRNVDDVGQSVGPYIAQWAEQQPAYTLATLAVALRMDVDALDALGWDTGPLNALIKPLEVALEQRRADLRPGGRPPP